MHHFKDTYNCTGNFYSQQTAQIPLKTRGQPLRKKYKLASCMWCFSFLFSKCNSEDAPSAFTFLKPLEHHTLITVLCSHCFFGRASLLQGLWYTGDEGRLGQHGELQENRNALEWEGSKGVLPFPAYRKVSINLPKFPPLYVVENEVWH